MIATALGVILGGLLVMWAVSIGSHKDRVLVVARHVAVGQKIAKEDLAGADLSVDPRVASVLVSQADSVLGKVALVDLPEGTLLGPRQVGAQLSVGEGEVLVPVSAKIGQLPATGVVPGQRVWLVPTPVKGTGVDPKTPVGSPVDAVVVQQGAMDVASGITVVDVTVARASSGAVAAMSATGAVTVVVLPDGAGS